MLCGINQAFRKMVSDVAVDGVQKILDGKKEKIDKDYQFLENMICKGEKPSLMPVKIGEGEITREKTKLFHEINSMKKESESK